MNSNDAMKSEIQNRKRRPKIFVNEFRFINNFKIIILTQVKVNYGGSTAPNQVIKCIYLISCFVAKTKVVGRFAIRDLVVPEPVSDCGKSALNNWLIRPM